MSSQKNDKAMEDSLIPAGFSVIRAPNNQLVLVPTFLVPATQLALEGNIMRTNLAADDGTPGPRDSIDASCEVLAGGQVQIPADPPFCDREILGLHAEVKALQNTLGLSYKDAAHRLYMAEVAKINTEKQAEHAMASIRENIDRTIVNDIYPPITNLDTGDLYFPTSSAGDR